MEVYILNYIEYWVGVLYALRSHHHSHRRKSSQLSHWWVSDELFIFVVYVMTPHFTGISDFVPGSCLNQHKDMVYECLSFALIVLQVGMSSVV